MIDLKPAEEYKERPQELTPEQAAQLMVGKQKITILTGAGISAPSGIPTFRGNDGMWYTQKRYAGESDPKDICLRSFFDVNPMAVWEWHLDFLKLMVGKEVNEGHTAVTKFQEYCQQTPSMDSILVTQNIDDLHSRLVKKSPILSRAEDARCVHTDGNRRAFTPFVYEIHGNASYMHCSDETSPCSRVLLPSPSLETFAQAEANAPQATVVND